MYICICNAITDDQVKSSMNKGLKGKELLKALGVGNNCGTCVLNAVKMFEGMNEISKTNTSSKLLEKEKI